MIVLLKDDLRSDGNNNLSISEEPPSSRTATFQSPRSIRSNIGYSTRFSTPRQDCLRMYARRPTMDYSSTRPPPPPQQQPLNRCYLNELAQFGIFPSPRGPVIGSPIPPTHHNNMYMKHQMPPYGFANTPPPAAPPPPRTHDPYFSQIYAPMGSIRQRSPDSLCSSGSPTSSQFTDDDRNISGGHFTPVPIAYNDDVRRCQLMRCPSLFCSPRNSSPVRGLYSSSPSSSSAPAASGLGLSTLNSGPPSPCSPLSPGFSNNPFQFPSPSSHFAGFPNTISQPNQGSKTKLGSIFEESDILFPSPLRHHHGK